MALEEKVRSAWKEAIPSIIDCTAVWIGSAVVLNKYTDFSMMSDAALAATGAYVLTQLQHTYTFFYQEGLSLREKCVWSAISSGVLGGAFAAETALAAYLTKDVNIETMTAIGGIQLAAYAGLATTHFLIDRIKDRKKKRRETYSRIFAKNVVGISALLGAALWSLQEYEKESSAPQKESIFTLSRPLNSFYALFTAAKSEAADNIPMSITRVREQAPAETAEVQYTEAPPFSTWPVGVGDHTINSCFGYRGGDITFQNQYLYKSKNHAGIDIQVKKGVPIVSVGNGIVIETDPTKWGLVVIDHGDNIYSVYAHLDDVTVQEGDKVVADDVIGVAGGRGPRGRSQYSTHLHFGIVDKYIEESTNDGKGADGVLQAFGMPHFVNPVCYLDDALAFEVNKRSASCRSKDGAEKFCERYNDDSAGTPQSSRSSPSQYITKRIDVEEMLHKIDTKYGSLIEQEISGTAFSKAQLVALIATESGGNPDAGSPTGCSGLLQFCKESAEKYNLCTNLCKNNDYRTDAQKAIPAGVHMLKDISKDFEDYTDKVAFTFAAYNAGAVVIQRAITATGMQNPRWHDVSAALTEKIIADVYSKTLDKKTYRKHFGAKEERGQKVEEIQSHVGRCLYFAAKYEMQ